MTKTASSTHASECADIICEAILKIDLPQIELEYSHLLRLVDVDKQSQ